METKSIFKSRIFWLNIISALLGVTTVITGEDIANLGVNEHLQKWILAAIGLFNIVGNVYLRTVTVGAVHIPTKKKQN